MTSAANESSISLEFVLDNRKYFLSPVFFTLICITFDNLPGCFSPSGYGAVASFIILTFSPFSLEKSITISALSDGANRILSNLVKFLRIPCSVAI